MAFAIEDLNLRKPEKVDLHSVRVFVEDLMDYVGRKRDNLSGFKPVFKFDNFIIPLFTDDIGDAVIRAINFLNGKIEVLYRELENYLKSEVTFKNFVQKLKQKFFPRNFGVVSNMLKFLAISVSMGIRLTQSAHVPKTNKFFIEEIANVLTNDLKKSMDAEGGWYHIMDLMLCVSNNATLMEESLDFEPDSRDYR